MGKVALFLFLELLLLSIWFFHLNVVDCQDLLEEAGRLGLNEGSCIIFIRVVVVINMVFHFNVVDCQDLLEEARRLGLNGGSCRSLMLR